MKSLGYVYTLISGPSYCTYWGDAAIISMGSDCQGSSTAASGGNSFETWASKTTVTPYMSGASASFTTGDIEFYNFVA